MKVRYEGSYRDGTVFITTVTASADGTQILPVRSVVPGFSAVLHQMRRGDRWRVFIPSALAYGIEGAMGGRDLFFVIELVDFAELPPPSSPILTELRSPAKAPAAK